MTNPIVVERKTRYTDGREGVRHCYWCPGCDALHCIAINPVKGENGAGWTFTGTLDEPTYEPSQLSSYETGAGKAVCHTFIRRGMIQFLDDSTNSLAGQTVPLPPLPDWIVAERPPAAPEF